jgi:hypothetical protein
VVPVVFSVMPEVPRAPLAMETLLLAAFAVVMLKTVALDVVGADPGLGLVAPEAVDHAVAVDQLFVAPSQ